MQKRIVKLGVFVILSLILLTFIYIFIVNSNLERPVFYFFNIGQGDASLIRLPNNIAILIDGGPDNLVLKRLGEVLPFYRRKLDILILSHPHDDHIMGLIETVRRYKINTLIYMWQDDQPELLNILLAEAKKRNIKLVELKDEANIKYQADCELKIINPEALAIKKDANNSLIAKVKCGEISALYTGDNSASVEEKLLQTTEDWSAQIFKAPHHGSKTASSQAFLEAINPSLYIISVGILNRFGHPNAEIIEMIEDLGIRIKRTDKDGTIKIN